MSKIPAAHFEAASTLAVVVSSHEPLLFLSSDQVVIAGSASFCRAFDIDPATLPGRRLGEAGNGEWAMPKLASLLNATAAGSAQIEALAGNLQAAIAVSDADPDTVLRITHRGAPVSDDDFPPAA